jgi:Cu/Zn superoxide dismutase
MKTHAILAATLLVAGCATVQQRISAEGEDWDATLSSTTGSTVGGTVEARSGTTGTTATIRLQGAASGGRHPWHIHRGTCGSNGPIVGPASAYPVLVVGADGRATATATLAEDIGIGDVDDFYVNVHASPQNMGTIIACGDLDD